MEVDHVEIIEMELKYCERCGGLWIRRKGQEQVYCASCAVGMGMSSGICKTKTKPRLPMPTNHKVELHGKSEVIVLCMEGGHA